MKTEKEIKEELSSILSEMKNYIITDQFIPGQWLELRNLAWSLAWVLNEDVQAPMDMYNEEVKSHQKTEK